MQGLRYLFLVLLRSTSALNCSPVPTLSLKQMDAGEENVYGVGTNGSVYTLQGGTWQHISGNLSHVTVGPAGVWGVSQNNSIFKLENNTWSEVKGGFMKQIDAGVAQFVVGVNASDKIFCLANISEVTSVAVPFTLLDGLLVYYSCGPIGCWGVNAQDQIFYRNSIPPISCTEGTWQPISGALVMIEVATNGRVYGVNRQRNVYRRNEITYCKPMGTSWTLLDTGAKHVTYDPNTLWIIKTNGSVLQCTDPYDN